MGLGGVCRAGASVSLSPQPHTSEEAPHCLSFDSSLPEFAEFAKVAGLTGGLCAYCIMGKVPGSLRLVSRPQQASYTHARGPRGSSLQHSSVLVSHLHVPALPVPTPLWPWKQRTVNQERKFKGHPSQKQRPKISKGILSAYQVNKLSRNYREPTQASDSTETPTC